MRLKISTQNNYTNYLIISSILIYPWLLIWQGLDLTDFGYLITIYQRFFDDPQSVSRLCGIWLTGAIGGLWWKAFDFLGAIGFRIAAICIYYLQLIIAWFLLKDYFPQRKMLLPLLLTMLYCVNNDLNYLHYNNLSGLFYLLSGALLYFSLKRNNLHGILLSGFVSGINCFVRFPNILSVFLVFAILYYGFSNKQFFRYFILRIIFFILGIVSAAFLVVIIMYRCGYIDIFMEDIKNIVGLAADNLSYHQTALLFKVFIKDHLRILIITPTISSVLLFTAWLSRRLNICLRLCLVGICVAVTSVLLTQANKFIITGICYFVTFVAGFFPLRRNNEKGLLAIIALLILLLVPLGSFRGIENSVFGMWLAMPMTLLWLFEANQFLPLFTRQDSFRFMKKVIIMSLMISSLFSAYNTVYRDHHNRFKLCCQLKTPLTKGIFTTKARAEALDQIIKKVNEITEPDDYLLAYNKIPAIHFLTNTSPYLFTPWPGLYNASELEVAFDKAEKNINSLPVILLASAAKEDWPECKTISQQNTLTLITDYLKALKAWIKRVMFASITDSTLSDMKNLSSPKGSPSLIDDFISKNNYVLWWSSNYCKIYVPEKKHQN